MHLPRDELVRQTHGREEGGGMLRRGLIFLNPLSVGYSPSVGIMGCSKTH